MQRLREFFVRAPVMLALAAPAVAVMSCNGETDPDPMMDELDAWLGDELHVRAIGTIDGEEIDLDITEPEAADTAQFWCKREWEVPLVMDAPDYASGEMIEFKIMGFVTIGGELRLMEVEFKKHDFQADGEGATVTVVQRDDAVDPGAGEMWFEWEWHDAETDEEVFESAAQSGTYTQERFSGDRDATGLIIPEGEGRIGGFVDVTFSQTESLKLSFTLTCSENKIEEIL